MRNMKQTRDLRVVVQLTFIIAVLKIQPEGEAN